ncbi:MAG: M48 family metallopeptidase [Saprospiraceae bacterium]|nr:M48 family metallopeptidase [Saprospiraceae bacterium]
MGNKLYYIEIDGIKVPLKIIEEKRANARVALGGTHVILRVPKAFLFTSNVNKHVEWASNWLRQLKATKPTLLDRYVNLKVYNDGDIFKIGGLNFLLEIISSDKESGSIKLQKEGILKIDIPSKGNYDSHKLIKNLLIKFSQKYFLKHITERVNYYNSNYFNKPINSVRLKYNTSNWGSCSTGKNLNFSVRLFFAPPDVIDYVVIHELAHLIEMNHSDKFWKIVYNIMPDYIQKEKLLKANSSHFDF